MNETQTVAAKKTKQKPKIFKSRIARSVSGDFLMMLVLLIGAVFMIIPMILAVGNSFKPSDEFFVFPPRLLPQNPTLDNYTDLMGIMSESWIPLSRYIFNTVLITTVGTAGHIILASMCAYPVAKFRFPGSRAFGKMVELSLMFSGAVTAIPNYIIMAKSGLINSYLALIVPAFGSTLGLFLMKQFMEQGVPDSVLEAAKIDGCGEVKILFKIVMPMVKPAWLTLIIFSFQDLWSIGNTPFIFSEELKTLTTALSHIQAGGVARAGASSAVLVIMMIIPITIFIITQSNVIETMASSGMKE